MFNYHLDYADKPNHKRTKTLSEMAPTGFSKYLGACWPAPKAEDKSSKYTGGLKPRTLKIVQIREHQKK